MLTTRIRFTSAPNAFLRKQWEWSFKLWQWLRNSGRTNITSLTRQLRKLARFIVLDFRFNFTSEAVSILMHAKQTIRFGAILAMVYYRSHREWTKLGTFRTIDSGLAFRS